MLNVTELTTDEALGAVPVPSKTTAPAKRWQWPALAGVPVSRLVPIGYSFADQGLAVGGIFLVNVVLARAQTKEEYGMFALCYSVYTFLYGVHNAAILEPYTVYGSGRYRNRFSEYLRLMVRTNTVVALFYTATLLSVCVLLFKFAPKLATRALVGLGLTVGVLLFSTFLRRAFYVQRQAVFAAKTSLLFFLVVSSMLWLVWKVHLLDSFSVFLVLALGWVAAGLSFWRRLQLRNATHSFLDLEPRYWHEHWKYTRWVLATALVVQFTTQGYYWLVAAFISVKEVAELRSMYLLVAPVDQVFIALYFLVLPALASRYATSGRKGFLSLWKRYALLTVTLTALFAVVVRVVGRPAIHLLYAGKFDSVVPILFILAFLPLVMGIGNTMNDAIKAAERPKLAFYGYACSAAATFLLGIPLVSHFGLRGAAYGMLLSGATYSAALTVLFFFKIYKHELQRAQ